MIKSKEKICLCCEKTFQMRRSDARYCSEVCKQQAYKERKRLEMAASLSDEGILSQNKPEIKQELQVTDKDGLIVSVNTAITDGGTNRIPDVKENIRFSVNQNIDQRRIMTDRSTQKGYNEEIDLSQYEGTFMFKGYEVPKAWKFIYSEEELKMMEPEIDENGDVVFSTLHANKPKLFCSEEMIIKGNANLSEWISRIFKMAEKPMVRIQKLIELEAEISLLRESFDYRWLMDGYPYRGFLENDLHPKIKNWLSDLKKQKGTFFTLTPEDSWKQKYLMILKAVS